MHRDRHYPFNPMEENELGVAGNGKGAHTKNVTRIQPERRQRTLVDYLAVLGRRKWLVMLPLLLVPIVAYVYSARQPAVYAASSGVLLSRDNLGSALAGITNADVFIDDERFAETQAELARVPEVFERAVRGAGVAGMRPRVLGSTSTVTPSPNADLLTFTVTNQNPGAAARLATAHAKAFTDYRLELDTAVLTKARKDLEQTIAALRREGATDTAEFRELTRTAQELRTMELLQTKAEVVRAPDTAAKIAPTPRRNAVLGVAVGLLLGLGAALLWEALDKRVRDEDEFDTALGIPLLGRLPAPQQRDGKSRLIMLDDSADGEAEAVRRVRSNVEFANLDVNAKTIMVTSSVANEGKSVTVSNLALALARSGRSVVLVDLDLRNPSIGGFFDIGYRPGITDVAIKRIELEKALIPIRLQSAAPVRLSRPSARSQPQRDDDMSTATSEGQGHLWVLPAGFLPASPGELVGTRAVGEILAEIAERVDFVLVDAPPMLAVSDAITLSNRVDAVIVVVRLGVVNRPMLRELSRQLEASPARKLGFVISGASATDVYGAYGYGKTEATQKRPRATAHDARSLRMPGEDQDEFEDLSARRLS